MLKREFIPSVTALTGGSGFIGRFLVDRMRTEWGQEAAIRSIDLVEPEPGWPVERRPEHIAGDVRDRGACDRLCAGASLVIHLAAAHADFGISRSEYFDVNVEGTRTLLAAMADAGVRRLLFFSSVAVYGPRSEPTGIDAAPAPTTPYGESKLEAERLVRAWADDVPGRSATILRPAVVFGPGNRANMDRLIRQIAAGRYPVHLGRGDWIKSLVYVENLAAFTVELIRRGVPDETLIYVDEPQLTVRVVVETIHQALGRRSPRMEVPVGLLALAAKPFDLAIRVTGRNLPVSTARVRKLATATHFVPNADVVQGFAPVCDLREGLRRTVEEVGGPINGASEDQPPGSAST